MRLVVLLKSSVPKHFSSHSTSQPATLDTQHLLCFATLLLHLVVAETIPTVEPYRRLEPCVLAANTMITEYRKKVAAAATRHPSITSQKLMRCLGLPLSTEQMKSPRHKPVFLNDSGVLTELYAAATEEMIKMSLRYPSVRELRDVTDSVKEDFVNEYTRRPLREFGFTVWSLEPPHMTQSSGGSPEYPYILIFNNPKDQKRYVPELPC
jgi:hypothetical protein